MLAWMRGLRPALVLAAAALLLFVVLAARGESPVPNTMGQPQNFRIPGPTRTDPLPHPPRLSGISQGSPDNSIGSWLNIVLLVLGAVVLILAVVFSARMAWRNRRRIGVGHLVETVEGTVDPVMRLRLTEAVAEARATLVRPGAAPGDAVIAAWLTLEHATEQRRAPHQTATEFTVALLRRESTDEVALGDLRELYQRARFSDRTTDDDAARAAGALDRIMAGLRAR
jgi:hypothetical protein